MMRLSEWKQHDLYKPAQARWKRLAVGMAARSTALQHGNLGSTLQALGAIQADGQVMRALFEASSQRVAILRAILRISKWSTLGDNKEAHRLGVGAVARWMLACNTSNADTLVRVSEAHNSQIVNPLPHLCECVALDDAKGAPQRKNNAKGAFNAFLNELKIGDGEMQQPTEDQIKELQKFTRQNMDLFNAKTIEWIHNLTNETDAARHGSARRELGIFLTRKKLDSRKRKRKQDTKEATGSMPLATRAWVVWVMWVVWVVWVVWVAVAAADRFPIR
jgi:hypothetical protein